MAIFQSEEVKMEIRTRYLELDRELDDDQCTLEAIEYALTEANKLLPQIQGPAESQLDSSLIQKCSSKTFENIRKSVVSQKFNSSDLAQRVLMHYGVEEASTSSGLPGLSKQTWERLGEVLVPCLRTIPDLNFLYGTFPQEIVEKSKRKRKVPVKENFSEAVKPKHMLVQDLEDKDETSHLVEHIYNCFLEAMEKNKGKPLSYFQFVLHPTSFSISVENIFYFSFLFKDKLVQLKLKDGCLHTIEKVPQEEMASVGPRDETYATTTAVIIDYDDWKRLVAAHNITKPMITPFESRQ